MGDDLKEALSALVGMVQQHCTTGHGYVSGYLSANAEAMRILVKHGWAGYLGEPSGREAAIVLLSEETPHA